MDLHKRKYYAVVCDINEEDIGIHKEFGSTRIYGITEEKCIAVNYINQFPSLKTMGVVKITKGVFDRLKDNDVDEIHMMGEYSFSDSEYEMLCDMYGGWETVDLRVLNNDLSSFLPNLYNGAIAPAEYCVMERSIKHNFEVFESKKIKKRYKKLLKLIRAKSISRKNLKLALKLNDELFELAKEAFDEFLEDEICEPKLIFQRLCIHGLRIRS